MRARFYSEKVLAHFRRPHNVGRIKNPDGLGKAGNIICGDQMWIYLKIRKDKEGKEIIKEIKFKTFGCLAAIASSSVLTDLVKGKTLKEALKIDRMEIVKKLGGLPPIKIHCSLLAVNALFEAIYNYLKRKKRKIPKILRERHRQIKKEEKILEKRYKDWIKLQKDFKNKK